MWGSRVARETELVLADKAEGEQIAGELAQLWYQDVLRKT